MGKVKGGSLKKLSAKTNAINTITTPFKTMNGKVRKLRVNVRNLKLKNSDTLESCDLPNLHKSVPPETRLPFVKLRRIKKYTGSSQKENDHINNNTLQDQCKVIQKDVIEEKKNKEKSPVKIKKNVEKNLDTVNDSAIISDIPANATGVNKKETNNKITATPEKPANGLKCGKFRLPKEKTLTKSRDISPSDKTCITSTNDNINKRCVKFKLPTQKNSTKSIVDAKINGLGVSLNANKTLKRQCVVKLKRGLQKSEIPIPSAPSNRRKCLVRLQRTPVMKKLTGNGETSKSPVKVIDITTDKFPCIDEVKRNNFRKLSLNQTPFKKLNKKNKNTNNESNDITKSLNKNTETKLASNFLIETEDQIFKPTNEKETNSSESNQSIRKNAEKEITQMSSAQLNQTKLKRLHKLSLKKPTNKTKFNANLKIPQFEPQQNSTLCFQPHKNSTLLEFGFNKDKNKEKQIKENNSNQKKDKEVTSNAKNQSYSQNFANKSQEIENILNSLEDEYTNDNNRENQIEENLKDQDKENENLPSAKTQSSSQNLFIKLQEKENLLNNCVGEYENNKAEENQTITSQISKKTNKFFHRHEPNSTENILKVQKNILNKVKNKSFKSTGATKKRCRYSTNRSSKSKRDNVYEFLSQSQNSDSDNNKHLDPAADIIKRLIDQGRVRVATNCKGKGKPILKRRAPNKQQKKRIKQTAATRKEKLLKNGLLNKEGQKPDDNENQDNVDNDDHFMDDFDNNEPLPEVQNDIPNQIQDQGVKRLTNEKHHVSDQEGTFSALARSVLIKQSTRSDLQRQKAKRLLEMAKKFVSTPKNKKTSLPHEDLNSDLSPIAMPQPRSAGKASPWRVDEDAHLPRIFNFNTSSGNLPSFSSDVIIPFTPREENPKNKTILPQESTTYQQPQTILAINIPNSVQSLAALSPLSLKVKTTPPATDKPSVLSSFSSNDSNAENMPPPTAMQENYNENNNIFDLKQLPNPKRALNYRSPLKAINILEVVHLPPYKPNVNTTPQPKDTDKDNLNLSGFEENLNNDSIIAESDSVVTIPQNNLAKIYKKRTTQQENLFGFEDFLTQTEFSSQECCNDEHGNKSIHDKLKDLRKLKPKENDLQLSSSKEESRIPQKTFDLFDNEASSDAINGDGMRQRGIKEMLCSTMIHEPQPSTSKEALAQLKRRNLINLQRPNFDDSLDLSELFKDPEPETTFNKNDAHRTYIRPKKRKRRLKQNNFFMFLDSDESCNEHDSAEHHHSNETDTSSEKAPKKKQKRKEPKENPELTEFVHNFEEMCKEVDSYELIVERSA